MFGEFVCVRSPGKTITYDQFQYSLSVFEKICLEIVCARSPGETVTSCQLQYSVSVSEQINIIPLAESCRVRSPGETINVNLLLQSLTKNIPCTQEKLGHDIAE